MPASHHNHPEPEQRQPLCRLINHGDYWANWPAELQQQITRIAELQVQLADLAVDGKNWSDADITEGIEEIAKIWPSLRRGLSF